MTMNRQRAALLHLAASIAIIGSVLTVMLILWYPGAWFESMGGKHLVYILAGVDITIGPLLTFVVFQAGKKTLKFDLSVIACLQVAAFCFGLHVLYEARPAYMVFVVDQFRVVTAAELDPKLRAQARHPEFQTLPNHGPLLATAVKPTDERTRQELLLAAQAGVDLHLLPQYWIPYDAKFALHSASSLKVLRDVAPANVGAVDNFLAHAGRDEDSLRYLPLRTRNKEMAALLDAGSGTFVGILDARPWR
jgi:hypothetical protein